MRNLHKVIVAGCIFFLAGCQTVVVEENSSPTPAPTQITTTKQPGDTNQTQSSGTYAEYNEAAVNDAQGKKKVLFFHANWCPSCREHDQNLSATQANIPADVAIFKVNFDESTSLRQKYGVTVQHTFVQIDDNGNELKQWNSLYVDDDLQSILDKLV